MLARAMAAPAALRAQQVDSYAALALFNASVAAGANIALVVEHAPVLRLAQRSNSSLAASLPIQSKVLRLETWWSRKLGLSPALLVLCALCVAALCGAAFMHLCDPCSRASRNNTSLDQPVVPMASIASVPKASTCTTDDWDGLLANDDEAVPFASTTASSSFNTMPQNGHGYVPEPEPDDDHCDSV